MSYILVYLCQSVSLLAVIWKTNSKNIRTFFRHRQIARNAFGSWFGWPFLSFSQFWFYGLNRIKLSCSRLIWFGCNKINKVFIFIPSQNRRDLRLYNRYNNKPHIEFSTIFLKFIDNFKIKWLYWLTSI